MKTCSKCKEVKPLGAFSKDARAKDGLSRQCRVCQTDYYKANAEKSIWLKTENAK